MNAPQEHFLHGGHDIGCAGEVLALNILLQKFLWCVHNTIILDFPVGPAVKNLPAIQET